MKIKPNMAFISGLIKIGGEMEHLRFSYESAQRTYNENRHAEIVIKELGIKYQIGTPQSMSNSFWFWNCTNVPNDLPAYITKLDIEDAMAYVGWGISEQEAVLIQSTKESWERLKGQF